MFRTRPTSTTPAPALTPRSPPPTTPLWRRTALASLPSLAWMMGSRQSWVMCLNQQIYVSRRNLLNPDFNIKYKAVLYIARSFPFIV